MQNPTPNAPTTQHTFNAAESPEVHEALRTARAFEFRLEAEYFHMDWESRLELADELRALCDILDDEQADVIARVASDLEDESEDFSTWGTRADAARRVRLVIRSLEAQEKGGRAMRHFRPTRESFIPKGSIKLTPKGVEAVVYVYESAGRPCALVFLGKQNKPALHVQYRSAERREQAVREYIENRRKVEEYKAEQAAKRRGFQHSYKVGDMLHYSWGWEADKLRILRGHRYDPRHGDDSRDSTGRRTRLTAGSRHGREPSRAARSLP
jgi:hypothetical protein